MLAVYMEKGYTMSVLEIKNLHVSVEDKEILKGLNLTLKTGEIAAIMGPNGTGKSKKVLVLAKGEKANQAREAGADFVGDGVARVR